MEKFNELKTMDGSVMTLNDYIKVWDVENDYVKKMNLADVLVLPQMTAPTITSLEAPNSDMYGWVRANWSAVPDAFRYVMEVSYDADFGTVLGRKAVSDSVLTETVTGLYYSTLTYVRIKAQAFGYRDSDWTISSIITGVYETPQE